MLFFNIFGLGRTIPLSTGTEERVKIMFSDDECEFVCKKLLRKCGGNIMDHTDIDLAERVRFAVLKLSEGDKQKFIDAVKLANTDWRDVLMYAGFAHDIHIHKQWWPDPR